MLGLLLLSKLTFVCIPWIDWLVSSGWNIALVPRPRKLLECMLLMSVYTMKWQHYIDGGNLLGGKGKRAGLSLCMHGPCFSGHVFH